MNVKYIWKQYMFTDYWKPHEHTCPISAPCKQCQEKHLRTPGSCSPDVIEKWSEIFSFPLQQHIPNVVTTKNRLVPIIHGKAAYSIPEQFPNIDTWAVPVHEVMNLSCEFKSKDLKDYLGLPSNRKLILSTVSPDPYVEVLWRLGKDIDYKSHGVDLIFPGHFSTYDLDGPAYGIFNIRRQLIHAQLINSPWAWFRLGAYIPLCCFDSIRNCPNILISCQQMHTQRARDLLKRELAFADIYFPSTTRFWYIAKARGIRVPRESKSIFLNHRWLMAGIFGRDLDNKPLTHLSIEESLIWNLQCLIKKYR